MEEESSLANNQGSKPIIKFLHILSDIKYTYARTLFTSRILNPAEKSQEVTFRVLLPEEAFITGLIMIIKEKEYVAYVKEKEEAKKEYDAAVSAGYGAAHVFQNPRNSKDFTVAVNVEPQEEVTFNLTYEELLSRKLRTYSNEININPNQIVDDLSIVVNIEDILNITNVFVPEFLMSHDIGAKREENKSVKKSILGPNKFCVEWNPSVEEQRVYNKDGLNGQMIVNYDVNASNNPQLILMSSDGYFLHILRDDDLLALNKHVVFVLDASGSMMGLKINQLKDAMKKILQDLSEADSFSILLFSDNVAAWSPQEKFNISAIDSNGFHNEPANIIPKDDYIVHASKDNVLKAVEFINTLHTKSSTNILGALRNGIKLANKGLALSTEGNPQESMIIFLTDGQPNVEESDPDKIIDIVGRHNNGVTIFTLGFGDDADMEFLKKLSLANNGFARKIYAASDASIQLQNFYKEVASPILSDVKFEYLPDQIENVTSEYFKNLFSGSELLVVGKAKPQGKVDGAIVANTKTGVARFPIPEILLLPPFSQSQKNKTYGQLEKMWAYKTIKTLLDKNTVLKDETLKKKARDLALKYSFVTPLTSLVVVKPTDSAVVNEKQDSPGEVKTLSGGLFAGRSQMASVASFGSAPTSCFRSAPTARFRKTQVAYFGSTSSASFGNAPASFFGSAPTVCPGKLPVGLFGSTSLVSFGSAPAPKRPDSLLYCDRSDALVQSCMLMDNSNLQFSEEESLSQDEQSCETEQTIIINSLHIKSDIKYTYAKTLVTSRILNPAKKAQEVTFRIVLPVEALITGLVVIIKEKEYKAYAKEKEEALKEYVSAIRVGQSAAQVFRDPQDSNNLTVTIFLEAQEEIIFNLTYEELLSRKCGIYTNEININPNQIVNDLSIVVNIEDDLNINQLIVPALSTKNVFGEKEQENKSAKIMFLKPDKVHVEWNPTTEEQSDLSKNGLNGRMIVKYDLDATNNPQQILVSSNGYFSHVFRNDELPILNKHIIFTLDISKSMQGDKIDQLKDAVKKMVEDLSEEDLFSILIFSANVVAWSPQENIDAETLDSHGLHSRNTNINLKNEYVIQANKENKSRAMDFINTLHPAGETNIMGGLRNAISLARMGLALSNDADRLKSIIIFLTGGPPNIEESDPDKIIANLNCDDFGISIFTFGFGDNIDMKFMKKLSITNNGFARIIYPSQGASTQLKNFYKEVAYPVLSDVKFEYLPDQVINLTSEYFKNLFSGSQLFLAGKIKPNGKIAGTIIANSKTGVRKFPIPQTESLSEIKATQDLIEKMWAYKTIKILTEKNIVSKSEILDKEVKDLALEYSFVLPQSYLVVVKPNDSTVTIDLTGSLEHANLIPLVQKLDTANF